MPQTHSFDPSLTWPDAAIGRLLQVPAPEARDVAGVILCAGVGARMAPLTCAIPKPLLPALNCPLLVWNIVHLGGHTRNVHLNTHYLSSGFEPVPAIGRRAGITITLTHERQLSGPFGGVLACLRHRSLPHDIVVLAGDGLYDVDITHLLALHRERNADLTIGVTAVADGSRYGVLTLDETQQIRAMREKPPNVGAVESASCGVYVLSNRLVQRFANHTGSLDWVDLVNALLFENGIVVAARVSRWLDAGTPADLLALNLELLNSEAARKVAERVHYPRASVWQQGAERALEDIHCEDAALIGDGVKFEAYAKLANAVIGTGARIGAGVVVRDAVIMPGAVVPAGTVVSGMVWR